MVLYDNCIFVFRSSRNFWNSQNITFACSRSLTSGAAENERCYNRLGDRSFCDTEVAFRSKTNWEIVRGLFVLKLCSYEWLVARNVEVMKWSRRLMGKTLFRKAMRLSFYGHFVAGESELEVEPVCKKMRQFGVKSILDYSVEADLTKEKAVEAEMDALITPVAEKSDKASTASSKFEPHMDFMDRRAGVSSARTYFYAGEPECDHNADMFCASIDQAAYATDATGFVAIKLTALGRPQFLLQLSSVIDQAQHFYKMLCGCGWEDLVQAKLSKAQLKAKLKEFGVKTDAAALDEWFNSVDFDNDGFVDIFEWSKLLEENFSLAKMFTVVNLKTGTMEPLMSQLSDLEEEQFGNMMARLQRVAEHAVSKGVRLMVDAEQSYFQPAISRLALEMMRKYNTSTPFIFNTYQCYLKNAVNNITLDMHLARRENFCFGGKLVRGAYMEQERKRASELGYEDPINPNFEATSKMYADVVKAVVAEATQRPIGTLAVMCATHNEDSVRSVVEAMRAAGIGPAQKILCFGQLYGMCDQISYTLGQAGYSVYKYVPYGPIDDVLPYLSRRAIENSGMVSKALKERNLLWVELKRRLMKGQIFHPPDYASGASDHAFSAAKANMSTG